MNCALHLNSLRHQRGAVLPVSMFILLIVTLLAISSVETSNVNQRTLMNQQSQMLAEAATTQSVEQLLANSTNLTAIETATLTNAPYVNTVNGFPVYIEDIVCIGAVAASGYSLQSLLKPYVTVWTFRACTIDPISGARVVNHFGIRMQLLTESDCKQAGSTNTNVITRCTTL